MQQSTDLITNDIQKVVFFLFSFQLSISSVELTKEKKLAQDIHSIIEGTEDSDCNILKPLISAAKTRKHSTNGHNERRTTTSVFIPCTCATEFPTLKDTISTMQADIYY